MKTEKVKKFKKRLKQKWFAVARKQTHSRAKGVLNCLYFTE